MCNISLILKPHPHIYLMGISMQPSIFLYVFIRLDSEKPYFFVSVQLSYLLDQEATLALERFLGIGLQL